MGLFKLLFGSEEKTVAQKPLTSALEELESEKKGLEVVIKGLESDKKSLKEQVEELKLKKKLEDEDIKHMVKMAEESSALALQKKELALEKEKAKDVAEVKDKYRDKLEKNLEKQLVDMRGMYDAILKRLPDVSVKMKS